jgi:F-box and WD-40 domain protein 1/11
MVLRTLRTTTIAGVVERLTPLLHLDPVRLLPPEITSEIFAYLDPSTLLTASMASRAWRDRILDSRLWKQMYAREGWSLDLPAVRDFEKIHSEFSKSENRKTRTRRADTDAGQHKNKRRLMAQGSGLMGDSSPVTESCKDGGQSKGLFGNGTFGSRTDSLEADSQGDQEMRDVVDDGASSSLQTSPWSRRKANAFSRQDSGTSDKDEAQLSPVTSRRGSMNTGSPRNLSKLSNPSALLHQFSSTAKINWHHLYKQRRRLEDNWNTGTFTNFQLPHPEYSHEAHTECVYTIQFAGKWLVSGSRDKTLRVWDLETKRLRGPPLSGHLQSVLCLQFDPSEEEDVIISGSSDTNVIVWQFSTGKKIHEIHNAHRESVLNLRFDSRYLVTCSKDKLIKIWSRRKLKATDKDYPNMTHDTTAKFPRYIVNVADTPSLTLEARIADGHIKTIMPYELLMTLEGHQAAVNAIQIDKDEIVSASGDRHIKVWNIHDGSCLKTLPGHQKGIACVQFDSRRIVSGSSDNTVRIFDHATGAEVACLNGHTNLVRTVQAGFGDLPGAADDLRQEAEAVDRDFWAAKRAGMIPTVTSRAMRRSHLLGNSGSRNPKDLTAVGAKIPPGGGGSQWGRIISGSYDETIIIWKKSQDGRWVVNQKLRQDEAARAAGGIDLRGAFSSHPNAANPGPMPAPQIVQHALHTSMASLQTGVQNVMNIGATLNTYPPPNPNNQNQPQTQQPPTTTGPPQSNQPHNPPPGVTQALHQLQSHAQNLAATPNPPQLPHTLHPIITPTNHAQNLNVNPAITTQTNNASSHPPLSGLNPPQNLNQVPQHPPGPAAAAAVAAGAFNHPHMIMPLANAATMQQPASRVFKLQFDARRIICCSQDPKIVGWDFAAGDAEIEECAAFFLGP